MGASSEPKDQYRSHGPSGKCYVGSATELVAAPGPANENKEGTWQQLLLCQPGLRGLFQAAVMQSLLFNRIVDIRCSCTNFPRETSVTSLIKGELKVATAIRDSHTGDKMNCLQAAV
jgi:hypothetical protein